MTRYYLGTDLGGTKSHALIADEAGRAVGFGVSGPGNHEVVGWDGLVDVLEDLLAQATAGAGIARDQIAAAGFGVAGYDWPTERAPTLAAIARLGLRQIPLEIANDTIVGLLAGAPEGWGVALVAGTSNNCRGWDRSRREGRVTGHGWFAGEYGGAWELVLRALQAVIAEWTRRGPATKLTPALVEMLGASTVDDLVEGLCERRYMPTAEWARLIFRLAEEGDTVARELVAWSGRELGSLACGVIRQLGFESLAFDVVLVGSLYDGGPMLVDPLRETIHAAAPGARLLRLTAPPVVGGVVLGMEVGQLDARLLRDTLIQTTRELLA